MNTDRTTIQLTRETQGKLLALGKKGDTYEDVILRLLTPPAPGKTKTRKKLDRYPFDNGVFNLYNHNRG